MAGLSDALYGARRPDEIDLYAGGSAAPLSAAEISAAGGNSFRQGLQSGIRGMKGSAASLYALGMEERNPEAARAAYDYAAQQRQLNAEYSKAAGTVDRWADVHGPQDLAQFALHSTGATLPYVVPSIAAPLAARSLGAGASTQFAVGAAANAPFNAGEQAQRLYDDPVTAEMSQGARMTNALGYGALAGAAEQLVPHVIGQRAFGRQLAAAPAKGVMDTAGRIVGSTAAAMGAEGITEGAQELVGQQMHGMLNPNRDTSQDWDQIKEGAAAGAFGSGHTALPGAIAAHTIGAARAPVEGALQRTKDAAAEYANTAVTATSAKVTDAREQMANWLESRKADLTVDESALTQKQKMPSGEPDATGWITMDDEKRHAAATRAAEYYLAAKDTAMVLRQASEDYIKGDRKGSTWANLGAAIRAAKTQEKIDAGVAKVTEWGKNIAGKVGDIAADIKTGYNQTKENAQRVREPVDDILEASLSRYSIGERVGELSSTLKQWAINGYSDKPGGEVVMPDGLTEALGIDPVAALTNAYHILRKEGALEDNGAKFEAMIAELRQVEAAGKSARTVVAQNIKPSAAAAYNIRSRDDYKNVADHVMSLIENDKVSDGMHILRELFADPEAVLAEMEPLMKRQKLLYDDGTQSSTQAALDDSDGDTTVADSENGQDIAGITDGFKPNTEEGLVEHRYYNKTNDTPYSYDDAKHAAHAEKLMQEAAGTGYADVRPQGIVSSLRERYADDPAALDAAFVALQDRYPGVKLDDLDNQHYVLRSKRSSDKRDPLNIPGEEFGSVTPQTQKQKAAGTRSANRWAVNTGEGNEHGTSKHGVVWFERLTPEGDVKEFATTVSKLVSHARKARQAGTIAGDDSNLADQHKMLMAGITSFLDSTTAGGRPALTGRVGFMKEPGGKIAWHGEPHEQLTMEVRRARAEQDAMDDNLRTPQERVAYSKETVDGVRATAELRAKRIDDIFRAVPLNLRLPSGVADGTARGFTSKEERASKESRVWKEETGDPARPLAEVAINAAASEKFSFEDLPHMTYSELRETYARTERAIVNMSPKKLLKAMREAIAEHDVMDKGGMRDEMGNEIKKMRRKLKDLNNRTKGEIETHESVSAALENRLDSLEREAESRTNLNKGTDNKKIAGEFAKSEADLSGEYKTASPAVKAKHMDSLKKNKEYAAAKAELAGAKRALQLENSGKPSAAGVAAIEERIRLAEAQIKFIETPALKEAKGDHRTNQWKVASASEGEEMEAAGIEREDNTVRKFDPVFGEKLGEGMSARQVADSKNPELVARGAKAAAASKAAGRVHEELAKGVPAFMAWMRTLSAEQRAAATKTLGLITGSKRAAAARDAMERAAEDAVNTKENAMAVDIHDDLGRDGFAATHDSHIKHDGKFDWTAHVGKGEGHAAFGAGTYLSTDDAVHSHYKKYFTAKTNDGTSAVTYKGTKYTVKDEEPGIVYDTDGDTLLSSISSDMRGAVGGVISRMIEDNMSATAAISEERRSNNDFLLEVGSAAEEQFQDELDSLEKQSGAAYNALLDIRDLIHRYKPVSEELIALYPNAQRWNNNLASHKYLDAGLKALKAEDFTAHEKTKSPTYQVSVRATKEEMLDWNLPLSHQSDLVKDAAQKVVALVKSKNNQAAPIIAKRIDALERGTAVGHVLYNELRTALGTQTDASLYLKSIGIVGTVYDAESGKNAVKRNYVIYDDSRITTNYVHFNDQKPGKKPGTADVTIDGETHTINSADAQKITLDAIAKMLGPDMKASFVKDLVGKSGQRISGDWQRSGIRIALNARDPLSVGFHESMHELISRIMDGGHEHAVKVLQNMADSPAVVRQMEIAFAGEDAVLKAIKADPEERIAYAFQLWAAGRLTVGPETRTIFNKIADFIRKMIGVLSADQKAVELMEKFVAGELSERGAMARVLDTQEARDEYLRKINELIKPIMTTGAEYVGFAESELTGSDNPHLDSVGRSFNNKTGVQGDKQGYLSAKAQMYSKFDNKFGNILRGHSKQEIDAALDGLQKKIWHKDPAIKKMQEDITDVFKQLYAYGATAGVKRLQDGKWVDMGKVDDYRLPVAWDVSKLVANATEFKEAMMLHHKAELRHIADTANKEVAAMMFAGAGTASWDALTHGKKDSITEDDVLDAIFNRMVHTGGQLDLKENSFSLGHSPHMRSVNQRTLHWIDQTKFAEYQEKDLVKILTTYTRQLVDRAEYSRRFGPDGERLRNTMNKAFDFEVARLLKAEPQTARDDIEIKAIKKLEPAARAIMAMEGTLGHDISPTLRKVNAYSIVYQNLRLLGYPLFSSVIDPLGIIANGGEMKEAYATLKRGLTDVVKEWGYLTGLRKDDKEHRDKDRDTATRVAEMIGTVDSGMFMSTMGEAYGSQFLGDKARGINDKFFRWNGMEPFTRAMRIGATQAAISFIKRHAQKPNEHSARYFKELGLSTANVRFNDDGSLDTNSRNVQQAIMRWVDGAVLRPNAAMRPTMASDPHYASFYHLKQFMYAMHAVISRRILIEMKNGNTDPTMLAFAGYIPVMLAADTAKGVLQGALGAADPLWQHENVSGVLAHGAMRTGLLGPAQMLLDVPEYGALSALGPTVEQLADAATNPLGDTIREALAVGPLNFRMAGNAAAE